MDLQSLKLFQMAMTKMDWAAQRQKVLSLIAPVDGVAQQLDIHTLGGVVQPAQKLLVVVPAGLRWLAKTDPANTKKRNAGEGPACAAPGPHAMRCARRW